MNKIAKNYIYNLFYQIFVMLAPLVTAPYLSRVLGAKNLGIYSYVNSSTSIISTVALLGIYTYGNRQTAYYRDNKQLLNRYFWEIMLIRAILGGIGTIIYFAFASFRGYLGYFTIYYPFILASFIDCSWLYVGMEDMKPAVVKNFFAKLASVIGIFVFVKQTSDLWKYLLLLSLSTLIANLLVYSQLNKYIKKPDFLLTNFSSHMKGTFALFLPQVASLIYLQMDKVMIEWLTDDTSQISFYDQAEKLVTLPLTVIMVLSTVMMPRIANEFQKGQKEHIEDLLNDVGRFSIMMAFPLMFGIASVANKLVPWYLGKEFTPTIYAMIFLSPLVLGNTLIGISGTQYFTATDQYAVLVKSNVTAAVCNLLANILLIPKYAYIGAAIATLISSIVSVVIQYSYFLKQVNMSAMFKSTVKYFICGAGMAVSIWMITRNMQPTPGTTLLQLVIGVLVYLAGLILTKDDTIRLLWEKVIMKKNYQTSQG